MRYVLNPITQKLEFVKENNFSFNYIITGLNLCIPEYQQMVVIGEIIVDGTLTINGELVVTT